jgi:hypothetical protein
MSQSDSAKYTGRRNSAPKQILLAAHQWPMDSQPPVTFSGRFFRLRHFPCLSEMTKIAAFHDFQ